MTKSNAGRPTVMTKELVQKLEECFIKGLTDEQACIYVGISKQTLYNYCDKNKEFFDRKEELKQSPTIKAKLNINEQIQLGDKEASKWWLERKAKDEFSTKQEVNTTGSSVEKIVYIEKDEKKTYEDHIKEVTEDK